MLFFVDESGIDRTSSEYEVLAAVSIKEAVLWEFIKSEHQLEVDFFGSRLSDHRAELKGSKLLSRKRFRFANQRLNVSPDDQKTLAASILAKGVLTAGTGSTPTATAKEYTAFGKASVEFVDNLLDLSSAFDIHVFAVAVDPGVPRPVVEEKLRKDYVYLFERMFYYLEDTGGNEQGLVVFDELEKAKARLLIDQVGNYFLRTAKGKERSRRIVPEPFFVHSDLTTLIQLADIVAYVINFGFRAGPKMTKPARPELVPYAQKIGGMQYKARRDGPDGKSHIIFGITCLDDLRGVDERTEGI